MTTTNLMDDLVSKLEEEEQIELEAEQIIEGKVLNIAKKAVYVDLAPHGTGIIFGKEFLNARDILRNTSIGDTVKGKITETENEEGYIELSLKEARQALIWGEAEKIMKAKTPLKLVVKDANKGGIILDWQGIQGFLPASQLSTKNYPRVDDGDKDKILKELKKLIGETIEVSIINTNRKESKLILSEKGHTEEDKTTLITQYNVGDELECEVTGVVDFGIFLKLQDGLEGLVHISEIDWSLVEDPRKLYKLGDKTMARIIEIKDGKVSLSIKALKANPWSRVEGKYNTGDIVSGVVIKHNKHGALIAIEEGVAGLIHVSDFENEEKLRSMLELSKTYSFKITLFNANEQRMTLSFQEGK